MLSQTITLRNEWGNPGVKSHMGEFSLAIDVNVLPSINDLSCALCKAKFKKSYLFLYPNFDGRVGGFYFYFLCQFTLKRSE